MSSQLRQLLIGAGAVLVIVGLYLGFTPIKVAALDGTLDCGSAFHPAPNYFAGELVRAECDSKTNDRSTLAVIILVAGGAALLGGAAGLRRQPRPDRTTLSESDSSVSN